MADRMSWHWLFGVLALPACTAIFPFDPRKDAPDGGATSDAADDADAGDDTGARAVSCAALHATAPQSPTGWYTIRPAGLAPVEVFCDMDRSGGGWTRLAVLDTSTERSCPGDWVLVDPPGVCSRPKSLQGSQSSALFPSLQGAYSEVMGWVSGLQFSSMDGFATSVGLVDVGLTDLYVDGLSITTSEASPQHVFTYVVAWSDDDAQESSKCPCLGGTAARTFVGSHFYCESGSTGPSWASEWFVGDPLWDGDGSGTNCDTPGNPSVFSRNLGQTLDVPLEVRLMADQPSGNEDVGINRMELFVR